MARQVSRLVVPTIVAALLAGTLSSVASAAWFLSCSSTTNKICIFAEINYTDPHAATNGSDSDYRGDQYPNGAGPIDNTATSVKNWYSAQDVTFHNDYGNTGGAFCVDSLFAYSSVGFWNQDRFSSHQLGGDDNAC